MSGQFSMPVIRLTVESMRHTVSALLLEHQAKMDAAIVTAVENYCQPENIDRVVREAAKSALDAAISQEVREFFGYGPGRTAVREEIKRWLEREYADAPDPAPRQTPRWTELKG